MPAQSTKVAWLSVFLGALIWAVHFAVIYATTSLLCARGASRGVVVGAVGVATLMALAATIAVFVRSGRAAAREGFLPWMAAGIAGLAALAIVWEALPALLVPACQ
jgi:hypothetical protein